ncbi:terminase large subunit [Liquorilactobacillus mali]|uniref:Terminase large subunit n=1 Tax=Liquorilactobacillus mali KCTC 3596 = DSM 20444 TaxID=1046596 RepID=J1F3Z9_9LACO|nr:terminase TerL endonuclease subunit [Liquorilactobacillus mali]EJF00336.1 Terminase large subunit [Liquorilactobacillus mali KCTC 3596 = DSM 20444]KRN08821.1 terminase large subunit [Liquorilactobacillus mali KCTC 3596 = DSM 20444]QFQ74571.1 terminase large subunit [Liquorilactobacillus mali]
MKIDLTQSHDVIGVYKSIDYSDIHEKYHDAGTEYCFNVLDKKIVSGYLMKLACFRHLQDLKRQGNDDFPYHYSVREAEKLLKFSSIAPNVDTGEPTKLMDWQEFTFCQMFGWRNKEGGKRFSRVIDSVARGQGKTYKMAIIMCYSYFIESIGLSNQDYLVASINFKQTNKLFGYIKSMMRKIIEIEPFKSLANEVGLSIQSDQIVMKNNNNVLRAISHESGQYDSFHFTTAIFDEIGEIKTRDKISKIISGQVKVPNRQFIQISTSYPDPSVPFHEDQKMIQQAMEQDFNRDADSYLGLIWAQDSLGETFQPETWAKSNPLLYLDSQKEVLMQGLQDKRDSDMLSGNVADFQNKNLNLWLQEATNSFLKLGDIEKSIISEFNRKGRQVYMGFDYSMFSDNTAIAFVYPHDNKWHIEQHSFIPWQKAGSIEAKEKQDGINYRELAKQGFCTITSHPQGMINDDQVYNWILNYVEDNQLEAVFFGYDTFGATNVTKQMDINTSFPLTPIRQRTGELKDPTKFLQKIFVEGSATRLDDKIMEKALINAQIVEDKIGIQVDKASATYKIDVVDAIIDALYQAMYHFEDFGIANDKSKQVDRMTQQEVLDWFNDPESGLLGGD